MNACAWRTLIAWSALALNACAAGDAPGAQATSTEVAGWYLQREGGHWFQACGSDTPRAVEGSPELIEKARAFGLEDDLPVYVRLVLTADGTDAPRDKVVRVVQFGSPTPVKNCAMTGVVSPEPTDERQPDPP